MGTRDNWDKRRVEECGRLGEIDRRTFGKLGGAGATALVLGLGPFEERAIAQPRFTSYPFSLGVASGTPIPTQGTPDIRTLEETRIEAQRQNAGKRRYLGPLVQAPYCR